MKNKSLKKQKLRANIVTALLIIAGFFVGSFSLQYIAPSKDDTKSPYSAKCSEEDFSNEIIDESDIVMVKKFCDIQSYYSSISDNELISFRSSLYVIMSVLLFVGAACYRIHMNIIIDKQ